jgi:Rrf2 family transcriptional regulator, iron-sulfur cluster assembly transcription factor
MFSTSCHYGLQAMLYIALHSSADKNVDLNQIAAEQDIPKHFLSKILQLLVRNKLLISMKGPNGGFRLSRPADEIPLIEVVAAIDGLEIFSKCGIIFKNCDDNHQCPIHSEYKYIRECLRHLFQEKTLACLASDVLNAEKIIGSTKPAGPSKSG